MAIKAVIFDMDGTLLDTLEDLRASTNAALAQFGYAPRTLEEVRTFVGNGVKHLLLCALNVKDERECPRFEEVFAAFKAHYALHSNDRTRAYEGVEQLLARLKDAGIGMAIVSNKLDAAVKQLNDLYFADYIPVAIGENEAAGIRKKPAPDTVHAALEQLGADRADAVYVGDSEVDVATAKNAGLPCISVTWGFRDQACLKAHGAEHFCGTPDEVWELLQSL